jgi:biopolymer transport protein TolQ
MPLTAIRLHATLPPSISRSRTPGQASRAGSGVWFHVLALSQRRIGSYDAEARLRTLGCIALALQVQGEVAHGGGFEGDVVSLIVRAGPVAKAVLLILVLFSVASWGVILYKLWVFKRAESETGRFLDVFRRSSKFSEVNAVCRSLEGSSLVGLFLAGYAELNSQLRQPGSDNPHMASASSPAAVVKRPTLKSLQAVDRALLRAASVEVSKLERRVPFLATTAAITPFIGLFGTVWGIMTSFQAIGQVGSTNLAVVAPGIAEALIATAAGLFAAIPALYFYNHFTTRVKHLASQMDDFALEFLNISERNFT